MSDTDKLLQERGATYGNFTDGIRLEAEILTLIKQRHYKAHGTEMSEWFVTSLSKLVMKIARLSVSPTHADGWRDISGYATLVLKEVEWAEKPCKIWNGKVNSAGYGPNHVKACIEHNGPRPEKHDASHLCHNKRCYEPTHLIWETRANNMRRTPGLVDTATENIKRYNKSLTKEQKAEKIKPMQAKRWVNKSAEERTVSAKKIAAKANKTKANWTVEKKNEVKKSQAAKTKASNAARTDEQRKVISNKISTKLKASWAKRKGN